MPKAVWNDVVIAQTERFETVEGNVYFPPESLDMRYFRASDTHSTCHWKGVASYYDIVVEGQVNKDGAWYYPQTKPAAANIAGHIAFWRGVQIIA
ncbi:MAG: DUF427 domain-containing protein [Burkholderiales bacterium]|nr:DUF427 domain-containing protein [Burkholderiales bacterium]